MNVCVECVYKGVMVSFPMACCSFYLCMLFLCVCVCMFILLNRVL